MRRWFIWLMVLTAGKPKHVMWYRSLAQTPWLHHMADALHGRSLWERRTCLRAHMVRGKARDYQLFDDSFRLSGTNPLPLDPAHSRGASINVFTRAVTCQSSPTKLHPLKIPKPLSIIHWGRSFQLWGAVGEGNPYVNHCIG